jgi:8-oxo-dGTP pyrophosphatase MutT (NUDIX family)
VSDARPLSDRDRSGWVLPDAQEVAPDWLAPLIEAARTVRPDDLSLFLPPPTGGRRGAVLILFGESAAGPDVLLIERAQEMRQHAGQPAFPGGAVDSTDADPVAAALREAQEETGLDPSGVYVFGALPALWLPPSGFVVTPILAWWRNPSPVAVLDVGEVAAVHRIPLAELLNPVNRVTVRHPSGYLGPGFTVRGMLVWGFTGGLLSRMLASAGLEIPWEPGPLRDVGWTG